MARAKIDGVIEGVRYGRNNRIAWARVYERRGAVWSDVILMDRRELLRRLLAGKRFVLGRRKEYLAGTFELGQPVQALGPRGQEVITTRSRPGEGDRLDQAPVI